MSSIQSLKPAELRLAAWLREPKPVQGNVPSNDAEWLELANHAAGAGLASVLLNHAG